MLIYRFKRLGLRIWYGLEYAMILREIAVGHNLNNFETDFVSDPHDLTV